MAAPPAPPRTSAPVSVLEAPPKAKPTRPAMPPTTAPLMIAPASQLPVVTPWMIPGAMPNPAPTRVATIGPPGTKNEAAMSPTMAMLPHCVPVSCSR